MGNSGTDYIYYPTELHPEIPGISVLLDCKKYHLLQPWTTLFILPGGLQFQKVKGQIQRRIQNFQKRGGGPAFHENWSAVVLPEAPPYSFITKIALCLKASVFMK